MSHIQKRGPRQYKARYRGPDGREHSKTFERRADAERWLAAQDTALNRGEWTDPALARTLYSNWAKRWLTTTVHLKPKTQAGYESLLHSRVLPAFGMLELRAIGPLLIREWVATLQEGGLSASRIRQARQVLFASLQAAVESGYLARNPVTGVKTPRERPREMRYLSAEEVECLAAATPEPYDTLVLVLAYGGLRWGEAVALRRSRVDVLGGRLHVAESLAEVGGELHFGTTKTHRDRSVSMPGFLRDRLARHLAQWVGTEPDALVFTAADGTALRHSNFRYRIWLPSLGRAGLDGRLRIHDLRHTAASLLIAAGAHPKAIQSHLGHSSITVTLDRYGHLYPADLDRLTDRLEATRTAALDRLAASPRPKPTSEVIPLASKSRRKVG